MTHLDYLLQEVPDLGKRRILDVGFGRGGFLVEATKRGYEVEGIDVNPSAIIRARERASQHGVVVRVLEGSAEALPFLEGSFGFANVGEVLEHVPNPDKVLAELARVLVPGGKAYVSIPNRFGWYDPHYHVHFVNWLPRAWSNAYLRIRGKLKEYAGSTSGHQQLSEMHYRTLRQFHHMCASHGLTYVDSKENKIASLPFGVHLLPLYRLYAFFFISTFHGIVTKASLRPGLDSLDILLSEDAHYLLPKGWRVSYRGPFASRPQEGETLLAYPSAALPRFLIPEHDAAALRFMLRLLSANRRILGAVLYALTLLPGGKQLLTTFLVRECIVISHA